VLFSQFQQSCKRHILHIYVNQVVQLAGRLHDGLPYLRNKVEMYTVRLYQWHLPVHWWQFRLQHCLKTIVHIPKVNIKKYKGRHAHVCPPYCQRLFIFYIANNHSVFIAKYQHVKYRIQRSNMDIHVCTLFCSVCFHRIT